MVYAYDQNIQYPVKDLYDNQIIAMSIAAAKDMYEKGQQEIKDFQKAYGDFLSPFAKDMQRYNQIVGGVKDVINNLYANGIDPIRSAEGRAAVSRAIASVDPTELNAMKANAKTGYAYLEAMQKLRQTGKYSQAQEDFDMALTGTTPFDQFATNNGQGGFNSWNRISPIQATTLRDLTHGSYEGRTARTLTKEDFINDPRLKGIAFDPRYEYSGYVDSDLMKVAPGASASLAGDPRALFFRDLARQKVIAAGKEPTEGNVEAQFQRDIADANTWALIDPSRKADEFAKMEIEDMYARRREATRHANAMREAAAAKQETVDNGGGLLKALALNAQGVRVGLLSQVQDKGYFGAINKKAQELLKIKDPNSPEYHKKSLEISKLSDMSQKRGLKRWFYEPANGDGKTSIAGIIMNLKPGSPGVHKVNDILSNFATNASSGDVGSVLLEKIGFSKNTDGNYEVNPGENIKVVTPHRLLSNIIKYETSDYAGKQKLIKALNDNADTYTDKLLVPDWLVTAKTNTIANRTTTVRPTTTKGGVIVAPNDRGVNTLYVKVQTVGGFGQGDHKGYWVETPITYGSDLVPTSNNTTIFQASEESEGKAVGNSQRKEAYVNQN